MNIDVTALQELPAVGTDPTGLLPKQCKGRTILISCPNSCKITIIVVGEA